MYLCKGELSFKDVRHVQQEIRTNAGFLDGLEGRWSRTDASVLGLTGS